MTAGIATGTQVVHVSSQSVITRPHDVQGQGVHSKDFSFGEVTITIAVLGPEEVHVQLRAINVWEIALIHVLIGLLTRTECGRSLSALLLRNLYVAQLDSV